MLLMIIVFLIVVMFAVLQKFATEITVKVGNCIFSPDDAELDLRAQIRDLKDQQAQISMIDEFARYMKLQRQIDKFLSQVKESKKETYYAGYWCENWNTCSAWLHNAGFGATLPKSTLMLLPERWFFPVQRFVSFPSGVSGGVGIVCWILVCNSVVMRAKRLLAISSSKSM
ncbi:tail-anchored protein insertion receptor WRB-like [Pomacea canaliculata]|uniref:tail-anchored protein insertion receptor WRB-like n=1 Tax=Pomacea canaliculata TaxID=400727 RepID=UPI000D73A6A0|nr:tail-anchored protein insertion receptor WRB-like [Pomacea canaliculata]